MWCLYCAYNGNVLHAKHLHCDELHALCCAYNANAFHAEQLHCVDLPGAIVAPGSHWFLPTCFGLCPALPFGALNHICSVGLPQAMDRIVPVAPEVLPT